MRYLTSLILLLMIQGGNAQNIAIWSGENGNDLACSLDYFAINANEAYSDAICLQGFLDKWSSARISFEGCSHYRKSITQTQSIDFQIKTSNPDEKVYIILNAWHSPENTESPAIEIAPYTQTDSLSTNYQHVSIPLDSFRNEKFTASWVDAISFRGAEPEQMFNIFVDDISLIDTTLAQVENIQCLSNAVLELNYNERYDTALINDPNNFALLSVDDPNFADTIYAKNIGIQYYYNGLANDTLWLPLPESKFINYLEFDVAFSNDLSYNLLVMNRDSGEVEQVIPFTYSDKQVNGSVKVNQIGYLPSSPKYAYIGNYLGSGGAMKIESESYELRKKDTDEPVYSGDLLFRGADYSLSGEDVYECDFTDFADPGWYYIFVPGVGRSYDFRIHESAFDEAMRVATKGLFLQRCGMELSPEYAGEYAHASCHMSAAKVHYSIGNIETYGNEVIHSELDVSGGWHDAGDYSRPLSNQVVVISDLLDAYESFPHKFSDSWNIPESGNGIADILDEAQWGLDFLLKMQSEDGGVFYKVATKDYPAVLPSEDVNQYYVSAKTTYITAMHAAVMAKAARIFLACDPDQADLYRISALRSWEFLSEHLESIPSFGYVDELLDSDLSCGETPDDSDKDERAWAAAELYKLTGKEQYHESFVWNWTSNDPFMGWNRQAHSQIRASRAYLTIQQQNFEQEIKDQITEALLQNADELVQSTEQNVYRGAYRSDHRPYIGWGDYSQSTNKAAVLIRAYLASNNDSYLRASQLNLDAQFGNNPLSRSFVTGLGSNPVMNPIHYPSQLDGINDPIPGIPVYGAHHNEEWQYRDLIDSNVTFPPFYDQSIQESVYPTLRRHFDQQRVFSMNEFTIAENMSQLIYTLAFFSNIDVEDIGCNISSPTIEIEAANLEVFPNPAQDKIKINASNSMTRIEIFTSSGTKVYSNDFNGSCNLDISRWNSGMYFISLDNGLVSVTQKFVKL